MRINILVPGRGARVGGGFKVLYHHANGLADLGHDVRLIHTPYREPGTGGRTALRSRLSYWAGRAGILPWRPDRWFTLREGVTCSWRPDLDAPAAVPDADATIASFWHSAAWLRGAPGRVGRRVYLVQEYEYYMTADPGTRERMDAIFRSDLTLLAISPAIAVMLTGAGARGDIPLVPNGIEHELFHPTIGIDDPRRAAVGFPTRPESFKGTDDAIRVLADIRMSFPALAVWSFGHRRPRSMPEWVEFHERPSSALLRDLYNRSKIFLVPSRYEGWGLPGAEAMACAAALVSTDNGGVRAYARHGETALLAGPGDIEALADALRSLLTDDERRRRLAESGRRSLQDRTWARASGRLHALLAGSAGASDDHG